MIILNDNSNTDSMSMAERLRDQTIEYRDLKLMKIKKDFDRRVSYQAKSGVSNFTYVILDNQEGYTTDDVIKGLSDYIVDNGFKMEYTYVSETVEGDQINFHKFNVAW